MRMIFYALPSLSHLNSSNSIVENFTFVILASQFTYLSHNELVLSEDILRNLKIRGILKWQSMIVMPILEIQD